MGQCRGGRWLYAWQELDCDDIIAATLKQFSAKLLLLHRGAQTRSLNMNDLEARLSKILVLHFGIDEAKITPAANFRSDMAADSLDLIDLTLSVEDAFNIEIGESTAATLHTVGDLVAFIRGRQA